MTDISLSTRKQAVFFTVNGQGETASLIPTHKGKAITDGEQAAVLACEGISVYACEMIPAAQILIQGGPPARPSSSGQVFFIGEAFPHCAVQDELPPHLRESGTGPGTRFVVKTDAGFFGLGHGATTLCRETRTPSFKLSVRGRPVCVTCAVGF